MLSSPYQSREESSLPGYVRGSGIEIAFYGSPGWVCLDQASKESTMPSTTEPGAYIRWFKDLSLDDVPLVGGKNASLGEMYRELSAQGVQVPNGFAITADA